MLDTNIYKVIAIDNFNRDRIADKLVVENITSTQAVQIVDELNKYTSINSNLFYVIKPQEYELKKVDY